MREPAAAKRHPGASFLLLFFFFSSFFLLLFIFLSFECLNNGVQSPGGRWWYYNNNPGVEPWGGPGEEDSDPGPDSLLRLSGDGWSSPWRRLICGGTAACHP